MAFGLLVVYVIVLMVRPQEWWEPLKGLRLIDVTAIVTLVSTLFTGYKGQNPITLLWRNRYALLMWGLLATVLLSDLSRLRLSYALDALLDFGKVCVLFFLTMVLVERASRVRTMLWVIAISAG